MLTDNELLRIKIGAIAHVQKAVRGMLVDEIMAEIAALVEAATLAAHQQAIEAAVFKPEFDAIHGNQDELAVQFCMEIAGRKGEPSSNPDPVRLLEMAEALYQAEFTARTQPVRIDDPHKEVGQ